ncbi:MAG: histidine triad nucleotide-binding protein [Desulfomonilaceae bacterium]|nr:histidine triad nucleotide-binding protein [Desulfomonilaceae bacterium]
MTDYSSDCIFCKIIQGKLPARKVYEDDLTMAFWDANPTSPIHILIVPKTHIPTLNDVAQDDTLMCRIGQAAQKIAKDFGVAESGYRLFINVNRGGGQVVFHLHAHLVAGNDVGTFFIKAAIGTAILWRKLVSFVKGPKR